jgi:hypothetical protein
MGTRHPSIDGCRAQDPNGAAARPPRFSNVTRGSRLGALAALAAQEERAAREEGSSQQDRNPHREPGERKLSARLGARGATGRAREGAAAGRAATRRVSAGAAAGQTATRRAAAGRIATGRVTTRSVTAARITARRLTTRGITAGRITARRLTTRGITAGRIATGCAARRRPPGAQCDNFRNALSLAPKYVTDTDCEPSKPTFVSAENEPAPPPFLLIA